MKIGISTYSLSREAVAGRMNVEGMIDFVADNGGEQIELSPGDWCNTADNAVVDGIVRHARKRNILLSSYTVGANFAKESADERKAEIERIKGQIDIGARLGVPVMRCDAGSRPAAECTFEQFERDLPAVAECCGIIADYAAKYGIMLTMENHGFLFQHSERVQRLLRMVNRKNYRTTLDVGNFLCADEDPVVAIQNNISYAVQIHFKDFIRIAPGEYLPAGDWLRTRAGYALRGTIIGHGVLNLPLIADIIKKSGYDGCISVEFEGPEDCFLGCSQGMATLRDLFK